MAEKHSLLLAAVLLCLKHHHATSRRQGVLLTRRILSERSTDLHLQLISNHAALACASVCLLTSLVRFSGWGAREVLLRVSLVSKPVLHLFSPASGRLARRVCVVLVASLLRCADGDVVGRVLGNERLMSAVFRTLPSDAAGPILRWLGALTAVLLHPRVPVRSKRRLFTSPRLESLRKLYTRPAARSGRDGDSEVPDDTAAVIQATDTLLRRALSPSAPGLFRSSNVSDARSWALVRVLLALSTADDPRQRTLALHLLPLYPKLSHVYMRRLSQNWEPRPSFAGLCDYSFLASLLRTLPLPSPSTLLPSPHAPPSDGADRLLASLLPSGLGKRELTRAILSSEALLQRAGLILLLEVLHRVSRAMASFSSGPAFHRGVGLALSTRLPELQALVALRARCVDLMTGKKSHDQGAKGLHLYTLLLQALQR